MLEAGGNRADNSINGAAGRRRLVVWVGTVLLILALFASLWVPVLVAVAWAAVVILANVALVLLCRRFKRAERSKFNAGQWTTSFVAAETVYGIAWSLLALFTLTNDDPYVRVAIFAMVLVGTAANSIATRTLPGATLMSTLPATLTVAINLVVSGGTLNYALAAVTIGGEIFFVYLARQMHRSELERVEHQAEKDALIYELEAARETIATAEEQRDAAVSARDAALAERDELVTQRDDLTQEVSDARAAVESAALEVTEAEERLATTEAQLSDASAAFSPS